MKKNTRECGVVKRNNSLDLLRIFACVSVVLIHSNAAIPYANLYPDVWCKVYFVQNFLNTITRFSVPVFFMLSGAFALSKSANSNFKRFYCKSFYKAYLPTLAVIALLVPVSIMEGTPLINIIFALITGDYFNLWFMYTLFFLYLLTPFIIRFKETIPNKTYVIATILLLILSCASQSLSTHRLAYTTGNVFSYLSYYLVGDVIFSFFKNQQKRLKRSRRILICVAIVVIVFCTFFVRQFGVTLYSFDPYKAFFSPTIMLFSILLFLLFNNITISTNLSKISNLTFYVYLFHTPVIKVLVTLFRDTLPFGNIALVIILTTVTVIISFGLSLTYTFFWTILERIFKVKEKWESLGIWKECPTEQ